MTKELLSTRKYKTGYEVRKYLYSEEDAHGGSDMVMRSAFTTDGGHYVGSPKWAYRIFRTKGLSDVQPSREIRTLMPTADSVTPVQLDSARVNRSGTGGAIGPCMGSVLAVTFIRII